MGANPNPSGSFKYFQRVRELWIVYLPSTSIPSSKRHCFSSLSLYNLPATGNDFAMQKDVLEIHQGRLIEFQPLRQRLCDAGSARRQNSHFCRRQTASQQRIFGHLYRSKGHTIQLDCIDKIATPNNSY